MFTIEKQISYQEIIKKSKFITFLHPIKDQDEAKNIIQNYKDKYSDATHICYGYILDENTYKYYDDGEPTNSAGMPIYQVLKNNKLIYTLCVVIRYFGGVKLGVGGLFQAYSSGAINALKLNTIIPYVIKNEYLLELPYNIFDELNYFLNKKGIVINDKQFLDTIFISVFTSEELINEIHSNFPKISITLVK